MHPSYYFGAHACILAFDVTRKVTYKNLNEWYKELRKYRENIPVILVANKIDVDYKVTQKKFAFGQKKNLPFEFVSAADGTNVVRVFKDAIRAGVEYKMGDKKDFMDDVSRGTGEELVLFFLFRSFCVCVCQPDTFCCGTFSWAGDGFVGGRRSGRRGWGGRLSLKKREGKRTREMFFYLSSSFLESTCKRVACRVLT